MDTGQLRDSDRALWRRHQQGDTDARAALITRHAGLVVHVARRLSVQLPQSVEFDDLVSVGTFGLMQAVDQFEPARGLAFSTYAVPRIRGAMLDELRRLDWAPRSARQRSRLLADAEAAVRSELGRAGTPAEIARVLGVDGETYWAWREDARGPVMLGLDSTPAGHDEGGTLGDVIPDPDAAAFLDALDVDSDVLMLRDALDRLPERERTILALYYFEELTLSQIGEVLGLTESRISQLRSRALSQLREAVRAERVA